MPVAYAERKTSRGQAIRIEGGLFGPDFLELLKGADLPGQKAADFGIEGRPLLEEIAAAYRDAKRYWESFRSGLERIPPDDLATTLTRERWIIPFLNLLGYELYYNRKAYEVDGQTFAISHRAGENDDAPPVHVVGARQKLGERPLSGRPRLSPHTLVQEYLNRTEHTWGIVTNGEILRLLRKTPMVRHQAYVEFDLVAIFEEERFRDFEVLYRLVHRTRLPTGLDDASTCWLERYYLEAVEQGTRARDRLRDGVAEAIAILANGFLRHPRNEDLRRKAEELKDSFALGLYRDLLRLVYRFLFLLVAEERGLLGGSYLYREHYSTSRLRRLADNRRAYTDHEDLWLSLQILWHLLRDGAPKADGKPLASLLDLPVLDGDLFAGLDGIESLRLSNRDLLEAFWHLSYYRDEKNVLRRVDYAYLDVEELGSIYESLLDLQPVIGWKGGHPTFTFAEGTERKSTGSYYTPHELVAEQVKSALEPVLKERLAKAQTKEEKERAILSIKVCDPATGSGHFLLAAARHLGRELARIRTGEEEPAPERVREAVRDVVAHCIYGVDKNPLAVELCRVALWIESHTPGKPLTFLDHRIKCGDSLVGVFDLEVLKEGIPDDAFKPVSGDDKKLAGELKKRNKAERVGQGEFAFAWDPAAEVLELGIKSVELDGISDDTPEAIREKKHRFLELQRKGENDRLACDLWTAAFFQPRDGTVPPVALITTDSLRRWLEGRPVHPQAVAHAQALAERHRFFHWPLEFPEVFADGGFDVVLGNPPWERIKLQEREFFEARDPEIATAPNAAARKRLIQKLPERKPALWREYQEALHTAESTSRFLRDSGLYPLTGRGDINTYSVFAERMRALLKPGGRAGIIVPTGIATDDTNKHFFADLVEQGGLVSLFDFENREKLFPAVDSRYKFSLVTMKGRANGERRTADGDHSPMQFVFFATRAEHLRDPRRRFTLTPEDIARINPNTRTLPVFRTRQDAELTRAIYERVPVLVNERTGENPWGVRFLRMLDMSNDSHLFRTAADLEAAGYRRVGNRFVKAANGNHSPFATRHSPFANVWLPLYEAKMIWHYDHRFGTYEGVDSRSSTHLPTPDEARHADPAYLVQPWYWVPAEEVEARLEGWERGWLVGFRDVTNATNERTAVFSLLPRVGVGNNNPLVLLNLNKPLLVACLLANFCAHVFDYVTRQKIAGTHMNFFFVEQLPILPPSAYTPEDLLFIVPRVLELVYTAWDVKPFADDVWRETDETLRKAIRKQWEANVAETGGHTWNPPDWLAAYPEIHLPSPLAGEGGGEGDGIPFPPFKWDEERRAVLRAELDAYYARLYGLTRKQLRYILDPADLTDRELEDIIDPWEEVRDPLDPEGYAERVKQSDFPGETFRVLKEKEMQQHGEYRTRRLVLEAWERLWG